MSNLVIVAIPDENDRVWKVSSEKVPHLTLLFLGDTGNVANLDQIVLFAEHAANTTLKRFYLPVDRRGELGADKADVLFFKKGRYDYKAVRDFRAALLQDNNIRTAYDSATQREGPWVPHLTLGYPATPAKPDPTDRDYGFYDVSFTKIAVWTDNYDGPDFLLKDYWDEWDTMETVPMDVAMSDIAHVGVKGMHWGTRNRRVEVVGGANGAHIRVSNKSNQAAISARSAVAVGTIGPLAFLSPRVRKEVKAATAHNKNAQADKKWKKQIDKSKKGAEVHTAAIGEVNSKLPGFNNDKRWKNADGSKIHLPANPTKQKEYDDAAMRELLNPAYANAAVKVYGSKSPSERYTFEVHDAATGTLKLNDTLKVAHAAVEDPTEMTIRFTITRDENGHIIGLDPVDDADVMAQTADMGAEFLAHFGVKGMHWGQRKPPPTAVPASAMSRVPQGDARKTKIDTAGGQNHPAHEDAIKVAEARTKLKKSGSSALSNKELRDVATRLQLEQQVSQLTTGGGKKFVAGFLKSQGQQSAGRVVTKKATAKGF